MSFAVAVALAASSAVLAMASGPTWAQTAAAAAAPKPADRLLVEAKQLVYNRDTNVVSAEGNVQLYYKGSVLEADKVTYDRANNRVFAQGNAKLTDADGSVTYSDRFDLTDDFKNGFIDSLSGTTKDKTFFTSPRAERTAGDTTVLEKATYTACAPCAAHPERPPLWAVKAMKIVHKQDEQMIYFEDAVLELYGLPIAYLPYFSTPDPTVTRKTGFLVPHYVYASQLGYGFSTPFFWNLAPNYDLTLSPTVLSQQGFLGEAGFRHRLENGAYTIDVSGIAQADPSQFPVDPHYGAGDRELRGSIETTGKFLINQNWSYGWDIALFSDKFYVQDYRIRSTSLGTDFVRESISTAYLQGQGDRSFFDLRGYYIQGLSAYDDNRQQPFVAPTLTYNRTIPLAPGATWGIGGEFNIDVNVTSINRDLADYQSTGARLLDLAYGLYDVCPTSLTPNPALPNFKPPSCFLRGVGGDYSRASVQTSWQRKFIDPIGEVWTPFVFARLDANWLALNTTTSETFGTAAGAISTISNADQNNFFGSRNDGLDARAVPGVGVEWKYPLIASTSWASHVIEPTAQIIVRPNVAYAGTNPNEDAQSLVFDDTNLFAWDKFSGYDRIEGGTRANAGVQYTMNFNGGGYLNTLVGQSFQLAGQNPYDIYDVANTGQESGLDKTASDYVARVAFVPNSHFSLITRGRFSTDDLSPEAVDVIGGFNFFNLSGAVQFSHYAPQPLIGYPNDRNGLLFTTRYDFFQHYFVNGTAVVDLEPYQYDTATRTADLALGHPELTTLGLGIGYQDDCTTFSIGYTRGFSDTTVGQLTTNDTVLVSLTLRTLADIKLNQSLGAVTTVQDGVTK